MLLLHQQAVYFIPIAMTIASYGGVTQRSGGVTAVAPRLAVPWHSSTAIVRESECCITSSTSLTDSPQVSFRRPIKSSYQHLCTNASATLRLQSGTTFCPDNRDHQPTDMLNVFLMQSSEPINLPWKRKSWTAAAARGAILSLTRTCIKNTAKRLQFNTALALPATQQR